MTTNETLTATEQAFIAAVRAGAVRASIMVTSTVPTAYQTTCPQCGEVGHATLVARWGHCMRCHQHA